MNIHTACAKTAWQIGNFVNLDFSTKNHSFEKALLPVKWQMTPSEMFYRIRGEKNAGIRKTNQQVNTIISR